MLRRILVPALLGMALTVSLGCVQIGKPAGVTVVRPQERPDPVVVRRPPAPEVYEIEPADD